MYALSKHYRQRRAFITGAGAGLGRALCEELARDGWTIGVADINVAAIETLIPVIKTHGGKALPYVLDIADKGAYERAAAAFLQETAGIDVLINNAGIGDTYDFHLCSDAVWERIDRINRKGVIYGCQLFVPTMREQQSGTIVNVASVAAFCCPPGLTAYATSKAGVTALSECLYAELKYLGVRVSVVFPFMVNTNLFCYDHLSIRSRRSAQQLMKWFGVSPKTTAQVILRKAGRGRLYIPTSILAAWFFWFKRYAPQLFMTIQAILARRFDKKYVVLPGDKPRYIVP